MNGNCSLSVRYPTEAGEQEKKLISHVHAAKAVIVVSLSSSLKIVGSSQHRRYIETPPQLKDELPSSAAREAWESTCEPVVNFCLLFKCHSHLDITMQRGSQQLLQHHRPVDCTQQRTRRSFSLSPVLTRRNFFPPENAWYGSQINERLARTVHQ